MTSRLPTPGQDSGTWGTILNGFLSEEHNPDGSLKIRTDGSIAPLISGKVPITNLGSGNASLSNFLRGDGTWAMPVAGAQALTATPVKTSAYAASSGDLVPVDTTNGAVTITLPSTPNDKSKLIIKKIDSSANTVTISAGASDVFNKVGGSTNATLTLQNQAISLQYASTGGIWYISGDDIPLTALNTQYASRKLVERIFDIRDYGAKTDGIRLTDVAMTSGSGAVTSGSYTFKTGDIGKMLAVLGAGRIGDGNDGVLAGVIQSVANGVATINATALRTISSSVCVFGTNDDSAIAAAQSAAVAVGGGTVLFPAARTIVSATLLVQNYVSWAGVNRELSLINVVKIGTGTTGSADWLSCSGRDSTTYLIGADFSDFTVDGEAMAHATAYNSSIKPLNIYYVDRCSIRRVGVLNSPATAIPFDHSKDQVVIQDNYVYHPGRLAASGVGPGGSGIGVGTKGEGSTDPTLITGNVIIGTQTSTVRGLGNNGIFLEAQTGADATLGTFGYRIIGNVVMNMPHGIADNGSNGTIISNNVLIGCGRGIRCAYTTLTGSYAGRDTVIIGNSITGSQGPNTNGLEDGQGIEISTDPSGTAYANASTVLRTLITDNKIVGCSRSGIRLVLSQVNMDGVKIDSNMIHRCGTDGIVLSRASDATATTFNYLSVTNNVMSENGQSNTTGRKNAFLVGSNVVWSNGRLQNNDMYDLQASVTQTGTYSLGTGASMTNVRTAGNTGDA